jgi:hypothetical protein
VLGVTPRVTPDGLVVMEIDVERSRLDTASVIIGGNVIQNIRNAQASTTISARSGQTVVFAGLIETDKGEQVRGIPFLSDLPWVGPLFSFTTESEIRSELLIVMTPRVVFGTDDEIDEIRKAESERMSWCLADVVDLYGDVGFSSRQTRMTECPEPMVIFPHENPAGIIYLHPELGTEFEMIPTPAAEPHSLHLPLTSPAEELPSALVRPPGPPVHRPTTPAPPPKSPVMPPYTPRVIDSSAGRNPRPASAPGPLIDAAPNVDGTAMPPYTMAPYRMAPYTMAPYTMAPWAAAPPAGGADPAADSAWPLPPVAPVSYSTEIDPR